MPTPQGNFLPSSDPFQDAMLTASFTWTDPGSSFVRGSTAPNLSITQEIQPLVAQWIASFRQSDDLPASHARALNLILRTRPEREDGFVKVLTAMYTGLASEMVRRPLQESLDRVGWYINHETLSLYANYEEQVAQGTLQKQTILREVERCRERVGLFVAHEMRRYPSIIQGVRAESHSYDNGTVDPGYLPAVIDSIGTHLTIPHQQQLTKILGKGYEELAAFSRRVTEGK